MTNEATFWRGTTTDEEQSKLPIHVGVALVLGTFLWMGPYMGVNAVLLPAKTATLAGDSKATVIAVLSTSAMIVAAIANIIFGALSDLTRSKWGRRTPWILGGSITACAMLVIVSAVHTIASLIVSWCISQLCLNAIVAPLIAVLSDRVAPKYRGAITSAYALGYSVGIYGGQMIASPFLNAGNTGFYVLAFLTLMSGIIASIFMREQSSMAMPASKFTGAMVMEHFVFPTRNCGDYYFALFGKFCIVAAKFAVSGYMLFILTDYMRLSAEDGSAASYIRKISLCMMVTAILMTLIAGIVSDKIHSRKIPVIACSFLIAIGSIIPFFAATPMTMIVYALVAGTGMGMYNAVDQALNVEVLPNPETAAKDLGILNLANTGGQVLGPVLAAVFINMYGYHWVFPVATVLSVVGGILIIFIRKVK